MDPVPYTPSIMPQEEPQVDENRPKRLLRRLVGMWAIFWIYTCIAVGVNIMESEETQKYNAIVNHKRGRSRMENSSNMSTGFPEQFEFIEFVHFNNDSSLEVNVSTDVELDKGTFNEVSNIDGTYTRPNFVSAEKDTTSSLRNSSENGILYNILSDTEFGRDGETASFIAVASTAGDVDGFKTDNNSTSDSVFGEEGLPAGANSTASHFNNDGNITESTSSEETSAPAGANSTASHLNNDRKIMESTSTEERYANSQVTTVDGMSHQANSTASASDGVSLLAAAAAEDVKSSKLLWKVNVD